MNSLVHKILKKIHFSVQNLKNIDRIRVFLDNEFDKWFIIKRLINPSISLSHKLISVLALRIVVFQQHDRSNPKQAHNQVAVLDIWTPHKKSFDQVF